VVPRKSFLHDPGRSPVGDSHDDFMSCSMMRTVICRSRILRITSMMALDSLGSCRRWVRPAVGAGDGSPWPWQFPAVSGTVRKSTGQGIARGANSRNSRSSREFRMISSSSSRRSFREKSPPSPAWDRVTPRHYIFQVVIPEKTRLF